jgi:hypothetical protein
MGSLGTANPVYESHGTEIWGFYQFLSINRRLTPMHFERKFDFLKTHENTYTGPLGKPI